MNRATSGLKPLNEDDVKTLLAFLLSEREPTRRDRAFVIRMARVTAAGPYLPTLAVTAKGRHSTATIAIAQRAPIGDERDESHLGFLADLPNDDIASLRRHARHWIEHAMAQPEDARPFWWTSHFCLVFSSYFFENGGDPSARLTDKNWQDAVQLGLATVLVHYGHLVRMCSPCGTLFSRNKRQEYCSTACSQKMRSQRWYAANRDAVLEKRHGEYASAQHERLGARVKVARRKRVSRPK